MKYVYCKMTYRLTYQKYDIFDAHWKRKYSHIKILDYLA